MGDEAMRWQLVAVTAILTSGCAAAEFVGETATDLALPVVAAFVPDPAPPTPGREYRAIIAPECTSGHAASIRAATDLWREESGGRMNLRIVDERDDETIVVHCVTSRPRYTIQLRTREIWIDVEAARLVTESECCGDAVRSLALFVEGRAFGLPRLSGDVDSVMNEDGIAPAITDVDRDLCRDAGFCD